MKTDRFTEDFIKTAKDGEHSDPDGLQLHVRGNSKLWITVYNGRPFGERRKMKLSLGSFPKVSIKDALREHLNAHALVDQGISPRKHRTEQRAQALREAGGERKDIVTFGEAITEFYKDSVNRGRWGRNAIGPYNTIMKNYLGLATKEPEAGKPPVKLGEHMLMPMLARDVRPHHVDTLLSPYWGKGEGKRNGIGQKMRSLIHGTFEREIDLERYFHRNPASWRKDAPLSRMLGPKVKSTPRPDVEYEAMPFIVQDLYNPPEVHRPAGYLTTREAADVTGRDVNTIRAAYKRGWFPGSTKRLGSVSQNTSRLIPIADLKKHYPILHEPREINREDLTLYSRALLFAIFTSARSSMVCKLRWDQIKKTKHGVLIEYTGETTTTKSEHKTGKDSGDSYWVIVTDNVQAILDAERERQRRDDNQREFVFVHGRTATGVDYRYGKTPHINVLNTYLKRVVNNIDEVKKKNVTVHGIRTAFGTWATEEKGLTFDSDVVNLTLGHIIAAIRDNKANTSYLRHANFIGVRRELMQEWEAHCLSLISEPPKKQAVGDNITRLVPRSTRR
jgi:integrase